MTGVTTLITVPPTEELRGKARINYSRELPLAQGVSFE